MRLVPLCTAVIGAAALTAGCGGDGAPAPSPVRLTITAPSDLDVVHDDHVEIAGTVRPGASMVRVEGRRASVSDGSFRATVSLAAGTNVVDVLASAGRARPATAAIRVRREVTVEVPDLVGLSVNDARAKLSALGLKAQVERQDSLFDRLLPGDPDVCETDPESGDEVDPGETVRLLAARAC
jgi:multidrug efflux pump subunit AcrA (membrane-fusion protein)